jgi:hypothetical protein
MNLPPSLFIGAAKKLGINLDKETLDPEELGRIEGIMQVDDDFAGAAKKLGIPLGKKRLDPEDLGRIEGLMQAQRDYEMKRRSRGREMAKYQASISPGFPGLGMSD